MVEMVVTTTVDSGVFSGGLLIASVRSLSSGPSAVLSQPPPFTPQLGSVNLSGGKLMVGLETRTGFGSTAVVVEGLGATRIVVGRLVGFDLGGYIAVGKPIRAELMVLGNIMVSGSSEYGLTTMVIPLGWIYGSAALMGSVTLGACGLRSSGGSSVG